MKNFRGLNHLLLLFTLVGVLGILFVSQAAFAARESENPIPAPSLNQEEPEELIEPSLELVARFPIKQGKSDTAFDFEVSLNYQGTERMVVEFSLTPPPDWQTSITQYGGEETTQTLLARTLEPFRTYPDRVTVSLSPLSGTKPAPGEYLLVFEAASKSGNLRDSIELRAVVTDSPLTYELDFATGSGRLDVPAKAGEGNTIPLTITNTGAGDVNNVSFTSVKSEGWGTIFNPPLTAVLEPGQSLDAEVVLTPPQNTIAGDYRVLIRVGGNSPDLRLQEQLDLRVRVQTPSIWGGAGIAIVAGVIAGLALMFRRLGRR